MGGAAPSDGPQQVGGLCGQGCGRVHRHGAAPGVPLLRPQARVHTHPRHPERALAHHPRRAGAGRAHPRIGDRRRAVLPPRRRGGYRAADRRRDRRAAGCVRGRRRLPGLRAPLPDADRAGPRGGRRPRPGAGAGLERRRRGVCGAASIGCVGHRGGVIRVVRGRRAVAVRESVTPRGGFGRGLRWRRGADPPLLAGVHAGQAGHRCAVRHRARRGHGGRCERYRSVHAHGGAVVHGGDDGGRGRRPAEVGVGGGGVGRRRPRHPDPAAGGDAAIAARALHDRDLSGSRADGRDLRRAGAVRRPPVPCLRGRRRGRPAPRPRRRTSGRGGGAALFPASGRAAGVPGGVRRRRDLAADHRGAAGDARSGGGVHHTRLRRAARRAAADDPAGAVGQVGAGGDFADRRRDRSGGRAGAAGQLSAAQAVPSAAQRRVPGHVRRGCRAGGGDAE